MKKKKLKAETENEIIRKDIGFKIEEIDEKKGVIRGVFSTQDEDRHGEIIDQLGWKLEKYMTNPVILFAHDHYTPAVAQTVELEVDKVNKVLRGAIQFAVDEFDLAKTLFGLYKGRYMRAFSVGFKNLVQEIITDGDKEIIVLRENELREISLVNVGANDMALAYSKGIDVSPIRELMKKDEVKRMSLTSKTIEKISESLSKKLESILRADVAIKEVKKVETPVSKGSLKEGFIPTRKINKIVRQLLKEKKIKQ